jgi:hypothetical protein
MHEGRFGLKIYPATPMQVAYGKSSQFEFNSRSENRPDLEIGRTKISSNATHQCPTVRHCQAA